MKKKSQKMEIEGKEKFLSEFHCHRKKVCSKIQSGSTIDEMVEALAVG